MKVKVILSLVEVVLIVLVTVAGDLMVVAELVKQLTH